MKKNQIIAIITIAIAIGVLISLSGDYDSYKSFAEAEQKQGSPVQIVGSLSTDKEIYYQPEQDPNYFSFYMTDQKGIEKKVVLRAAKPQDFERSEQIVLTGAMQNNTFEATDMLMKCPSKYKDEEVRVRAQL